MANNFARRWIGTLRRELLDRTIIWNHDQLERLVTDYTEHYSTHRPPAHSTSNDADQPSQTRHAILNPSA